MTTKTDQAYGTALLRGEDSWVILESQKRRDFWDAIRSVIPVGDRTIQYVNTRMQINVPLSWGAALRGIADHYYTEVRVLGSVLFSSIQQRPWRHSFSRYLEMREKMNTTTYDSVREGDELRARRILKITEDAPIEVAQAAYRALSKVDHPDAGGSVERMSELNWAISILKEA